MTNLPHLPDHGTLNRDRGSNNTRQRNESLAHGNLTIR